jgi:hypothetical protein
MRRRDKTNGGSGTEIVPLPNNTYTHILIHPLTPTLTLTLDCRILPSVESANLLKILFHRIL